MLKNGKNFRERGHMIKRLFNVFLVLTMLVGAIASSGFFVPKAEAASGNNVAAEFTGTKDSVARQLVDFYIQNEWFRNYFVEDVVADTRYADGILYCTGAKYELQLEFSGDFEIDPNGGSFTGASLLHF